jgi:hypothetical protein
LRDKARLIVKGYKSIGVKWVHKKKMTPQGTIERQGETHSQRISAKGRDRL